MPSLPPWQSFQVGSQFGFTLADLVLNPDDHHYILTLLKKGQEVVGLYAYNQLAGINEG